MKKSLPEGKALALCVPVSFKPEFETEYSTYKKVSCPECGGLMWIGERIEALQKSEVCYAVCMYCGILNYGLTTADKVIPLANKLTEH